MSQIRKTVPDLFTIRLSDGTTKTAVGQASTSFDMWKMAEVPAWYSYSDRKEGIGEPRR